MEGSSSWNFHGLNNHRDRLEDMLSLVSIWKRNIDGTMVPPWLLRTVIKLAQGQVRIVNCSKDGKIVSVLRRGSKDKSVE